MQQQLQAAADSPSTPLPAYSSRTAARRPRYGDISPWGNGEEKKNYNPAQYFETFPQPQWHRRNRSTPLHNTHNSLKQRLPNQLSQRTKKNGEGTGVRLNLVTVDLDQDNLPAPQRKLSKTIEGFRGSKWQRDDGKEQPMRVRIFKRIRQKNQQAEQEYADRASMLIQELQQSPNAPFPSIEASPTPVVPHSMPKRTHRMAYLRSKMHSTLQPTRDALFPRILAERQGGDDMICKGELIAAKQEARVLHKTSYRSAQLQEEEEREEVLFLKNFSVQH